MRGSDEADSPRVGVLGSSPFPFQGVLMPKERSISVLTHAIVLITDAQHSLEEKAFLMRSGIPVMVKKYAQVADSGGCMVMCMVSGETLGSAMRYASISASQVAMVIISPHASDRQRAYEQIRDTWKPQLKPPVTDDFFAVITIRCSCGKKQCRIEQQRFPTS